MNTQQKVFAARANVITKPGLILEVVKETPKQVTGRVIGTFSPTHTNLFQGTTHQIKRKARKFNLGFSLASDALSGK